MSIKSKITGFEIRNQVMVITRHTETYIPSTLDDHGHYAPARLVTGKKVHNYPLTPRRHQNITRAFDSVYGPPGMVDINIRYEG